MPQKGGPRRGSSRKKDEAPHAWSGGYGGSRSKTPDSREGGPMKVTLGDIRRTAERLERTIRELIRNGSWGDVSRDLPPHRGAGASESGRWPRSNISTDRNALFDEWTGQDFVDLLWRMGADPLPQHPDRSDHDVAIYAMGYTRGDTSLSSLSLKVFKAKMGVSGTCRKWEETMLKNGVQVSASQRLLQAVLAMAQAEQRGLMKNWRREDRPSGEGAGQRSSGSRDVKRQREEEGSEEGRERVKREKKEEKKGKKEKEEEDNFGLVVVDVKAFKPAKEVAVKEEVVKVKEEGKQSDKTKEEESSARDSRVTRSKKKGEGVEEKTPTKAEKKGEGLLAKSPSFVGGIDATEPFRTITGKDFENPGVMEAEYLAAYQLISGEAIVQSYAAGKGIEDEKDRQSYNLRCHYRDTAWDLIILPDITAKRAGQKNEKVSKEGWEKALLEARKVDSSVRQKPMEEKVRAEAKLMKAVVEELMKLNREGKKRVLWGKKEGETPRWLRLELQEEGMTPASPQWKEKLEKMKEEMERERKAEKRKEEEEGKERERAQSGRAIISHTIFQKVWDSLTKGYAIKVRKGVEDAMISIHNTIEEKGLLGDLDPLQIQILDRCSDSPTGTEEEEHLELRQYAKRVQKIAVSNNNRTKNFFNEQRRLEWTTSDATKMAKVMREGLAKLLEKTTTELVEYAHAFDLRVEKYVKEYKDFAEAKKFAENCVLDFDVDIDVGDVEEQPEADREEENEGGEEEVVTEEEDKKEAEEEQMGEQEAVEIEERQQQGGQEGEGEEEGLREGQEREEE